MTDRSISQRLRDTADLYEREDVAPGVVRLAREAADALDKALTAVETPAPLSDEEQTALYGYCMRDPRMYALLRRLTSAGLVPDPEPAETTGNVCDHPGCTLPKYALHHTHATGSAMKSTTEPQS